MVEQSDFGTTRNYPCSLGSLHYCHTIKYGMNMNTYTRPTFLSADLIYVWSASFSMAGRYVRQEASSSSLLAGPD